MLLDVTFGPSNKSEIRDCFNRMIGAFSISFDFCYLTGEGDTTLLKNNVAPFE